MAGLVVSDLGCEQALKNIFNLSGTTYTFVMHLYKNNYTPTKASVAADFTEVDSAEIPGYIATALTGATLLATVAHVSKVQWDLVSWSFTGGVGGDKNIYGYYVTTSLGVLIWSERFNPSPEIVFNGSARDLNILPQFTDESKNP